MKILNLMNTSFISPLKNIKTTKALNFINFKSKSDNFEKKSNNKKTTIIDELRNNKQDIISRYRNGEALESIADSCGCSLKLIWYLLNIEPDFDEIKEERKENRNIKYIKSSHA